MPSFSKISKQMQLSIKQSGHIVQTPIAESMMDDETRCMPAK
jgi:hypothetical protein